MKLLFVAVFYLLTYGGGDSEVDLRNRVGKLAGSALCLCKASTLCSHVSAVCTRGNGFDCGLGVSSAMVSALAATMLLVGNRMRCPIFLSGKGRVAVGKGVSSLDCLSVGNGRPGADLDLFVGRRENLNDTSSGVVRRGTRAFVHRRGSSLTDICLLSGCFMRAPRPSCVGVGRVARTVANTLLSHPCVRGVDSCVSRLRGIAIKGSTPCFDLPGRGNRGLSHSTREFEGECLLLGF